MNTAQKKRKINFNLIDVILIVTALVAVVTLTFFFSQRKVISPVSNDNVEVEYEIELSPVREEFRNLIEIGDSVINTALMENIGEVVDVSYSECYYKGVNSENGHTVLSTYPGMITVVITVRADAVKTSYGYQISGYDIIIGQDVSLRVPNFTGVGTCKSVSSVEQ